MKKLTLTLSVIVMCALVLAVMLGGCFQDVYVTDIVQTSSDNNSKTYTIYYSDGTTSSFTVTNGTDGKDGADVTIADVYNKYVEEYGYISYDDFLAKYLSFFTDYSNAIANNLNSTMKLYTEFVETSYAQGLWGQSTHTSDVALYTGSAVIWSIDSDPNGYTYILTNYHVVYDAGADSTRNGGYIARKIYCYLYGSEDSPIHSGKKDSDGYTAYDYGPYAVACEYVGGTVTYDLAVLRAKTSQLRSINSAIKAVTLADDYHVGQTAIAVGNAEDYGLSVTQGIVSVDNEYITLSIDGVSRSYRSIRMDTAIYGGNSGGGLFNADGKLIGLTNAGSSTDENINFAIPIDLIKPAVENILTYFFDGNSQTNGVHCFTLGVTVLAQNSKYVYDAQVGYGKISEEVVISSISDSYPAGDMGLKINDIILSVTVNQTEYKVDRTFFLTDILLTVRAGDAISVTVLRNGQQVTTNIHYASSKDLYAVA